MMSQDQLCCGNLQVVIQLAEDVNQVQYNLVAVEGCVCSVLVIVWMFIITTKVWHLQGVHIIKIDNLQEIATKLESLTFDTTVLLPVACCADDADALVAVQHVHGKYGGM